MPAVTEVGISRLLDALYGAGLDQQSWPDVLAQLCGVLGANGGMIFTPGLAPNGGGLWATQGVPDTSIVDYVQHYHREDLWLDAAMRLAEGHPSVMTSPMLVERDRFDRSEWKNDFLRPMDFYHLCAAAPLTGGDGAPRTHVALYRTAKMPDFTSKEIALMRRLQPHLRRALQIHWQLRGDFARGATAIAALDRAEIGVVLADSSGKIIHCNRMAQAMLDARDGVAIRNGRLVAAGASGEADVPMRPLPASHRIERRSGGAPYIATAVALHDGASLAAVPGGAIAIFLSDLTPPAFLLSMPLAEALGITAAETRLVNRMLGAGSLGEAAEALGISVHTARSQMKSVLAKTGTGRQADLVALLMQASARMGGP